MVLASRTKISTHKIKGRVPLYIRGSLSVSREHTLGIPASALDTDESRAFNLTLGLLPIAHLTSLRPVISAVLTHGPGFLVQAYPLTSSSATCHAHHGGHCVGGVDRSRVFGVYTHRLWNCVVHCLLIGAIRHPSSTHAHAKTEVGGCS